jgi:hypothetical protein
MDVRAPDEVSRPESARKRWAHAFHLLSNSELRPRIRYVDKNPDELASRVRARGRGAILITFHFADYPLLLCASDLLQERCVVIATRDIVAEWDRHNVQARSGIEFTSNLNVQHLRDCRARPMALFMMADVSFGNAPQTFVPAYNSIVGVSAYWAEIARRLDVEVVVLLGRLVDDELLVHATTLSQSGEGAFPLVRRAFRYLEEQAPSEEHLWENGEKLRQGHIAVGSGWRGLQPLMTELARCDEKALQALRVLADTMGRRT